MNTILLTIACGLIVLVALFHSYAGQKRLIGPLLSKNVEFLKDPTWRALILFGWHSTTVLMLLIALYIGLVVTGHSPGNGIMIGLTGLAFIGLGSANAIMAKFKHPGWLMLSGIGALIFLSLYI